MSSSDAGSGGETGATLAALDRLSQRDDLSADDVRAVVTAATRLYARATVRAGVELPPLAADVSATEALTLACALVRAHGLTPFEMAVWFGRGQAPA